MKKFLKIALLSVAVAAFAGQAFAQKKIIIGHFGDPTPYHYAASEGRFDKATGWTIEWRKFGSGAEVNAAMASGSIVMSEIGSAPLSAGASSGLDYQAFLISAKMDYAESLIVRNGSGIEIDKPATLKGKKIAVPIGSTAHYSMMGALKHWNMTEKDIQLIGMAPPEIAAAYSQGAIDGGFIWEPVQAKLRANGKRMVTAGEIAKWGFPTYNAFVVNTKFAADNKKEIAAFTNVMNEVNEQYRKEKATWTADSAPVKAISKITGAPAADVVIDLGGAVWPTGAEQVSNEFMGGINASMKSTAEFLKSAGRIQAVGADYSKFSNASFANAAIGK